LVDPLAEAFDLFNQRVEPSAPQRTAAEIRGRHVSHLLSQNAQILECRLVGSLVRSTAIQRFSDVDILAIFDPKEVDSRDSEKLLDLTAQIVGSLSHAVTRTPITISLQYPDWPNIDILPGWVADGEHQAFRIPAGTGRAWQLFFPSQHDRIVREGSGRLGSRFRIIIRVIKWWNQLNGGPLESYEIEELINELFKLEIPEYTEAIYRIFSAITHRLIDAEDNDCSADSNNSVSATVRTAWLLSQQARELATEGHSKKDIKSLFRRLFGERFPVVCS
jgi:predicted nucleotidyltransferase